MSLSGKVWMRAALAWAVMKPSGTRRATQTAPFLPSPLPMISSSQASFGSEMEIDSPVEA